MELRNCATGAEKCDEAYGRTEGRAAGLRATSRAMHSKTSVGRAVRGKHGCA
jgi:hypothetical protein